MMSNPQWLIDLLPKVHAVAEEVKADQRREADAAAQRKADMNKGW